MATSNNPIINALARGRREVIEEQQLAQDAEAFAQEQKLNEQRLKQFESELRMLEEQDKRTLGTQKFQARELVRQALQGTGGVEEIAKIGKAQMGPQEPQMLPQVTGELAVPGMPQQIAPLQVAEGPLGQETFTGEEILSGTHARRSAQEEALANIQQEAIAKETPRLERELSLEDARYDRESRIESIKQAGRELVAEGDRISRELIAGNHDSAMMDAAHIRGKYQKEAARLKTEGAAADELAILGRAEDASFGRIALSGSKTDMRVRAEMAKQGVVPVTPKQLERSSSLTSLTGTIKDIKAFAKEAKLPAGLREAYIQKGWEGVKNLFGQSEIVIKLETLRARASRVAELMGEEGRKTEGDVQRAIDAMLRLGLTDKLAQERIETLERDLNATFNGILAGVPATQRRAIIQDIVEEEVDVLGISSETEELRKLGVTGDAVRQLATDAEITEKEAREILTDEAKKLRKK